MVTDEATPKGTVVAVGPGKMSEKVRRVGEVSSRRPSLSAHSRRKWAVQCQCLVWRTELLVRSGVGRRRKAERRRRCSGVVTRFD